MFRPNLAGRFDATKQSYPALVSPKLDGIRCLAMNGVAMSRTMKPLPNRYIQSCFEGLSGLDGELIVGPSTAKDCYRVTNSAVMSEDGRPDFKFVVFDRWDMSPAAPFTTRFACIDTGLPMFCAKLGHRMVAGGEELAMMEEDWVNQGFEGLMIRALDGLYKQGRSTTGEGGLLKLKRYEDAEAEIVGVEELMHNANAAVRDERGYTKRSTHQANKWGMGALGAFICRGQGAFEGVQFSVGTGISFAERTKFWDTRESLVGRHLRYKYFAVGVKDAPRHPVFQGFRELGT